jgi:alpha-glucoside transport system substrate-binding protein
MRRLRSLVGVLAAAALVAATLTVVAVNRGREASALRDDSTVLALTEGALSDLATAPDRSVMLALHAVDLSASNGDAVPAATVEALHWAMQEANVAYPVRDGPTAVVAGPEGRRGIIDLPLAQVANTALAADVPPLGTADCRHFFGTRTCPPLPSTFPAGIEAEPVRAVPPADPAKPLAGTEVTFFAGYNPDDIEGYRAAFEPFTERTGIGVRLVGNPEVFQSVDEMIEADDPPDLATAPQPASIHEWADDGNLVDLGAFLDSDALAEEQSPYLVSLGTSGDDGSWPAPEGRLFGLFVRLNVKGMIWYPEPEFREAGYDIPTTWDELIALTDRMIADGRTPWCMGWGDNGGPSDASGWPGTDWIENLVVDDSGTQAYDAWTVHDLPFTSPEVRDAFERLGRVLFTEGSVAPGSIETEWFDADRPVLHDPPRCWLSLDPSFVTGVLPKGSVGTTTDFFPFPAGDDRPLVGAGDLFGAFSDRPEVREVVRFMLSPGFGTALAANGGFISANRHFDLDRYPPFERHQAEVLYAALATDSFRFDASDLMPVDVNFAFWDGMMRYAAQGPSSLDGILRDIDASWGDDST